VIPLRDEIQPSRAPVVTWALIAICVLVFLLQQSQGDDLEEGITAEFAMVPARVLGDEAVVLEMPVPDRYGRLRMERIDLPPAAVPEWLTLLTCIFLHGSWLHLIGNLWILYIFGDNVEDRFGRVLYLFFYLGSGVVASATHLLSSPGSPVPTVGASGAIAGVMGAYLLLYPHARVLALIPLGFIMQLMVVPASVFLGLWFLLQLLQGSLAGGGEAGGVAWWAHIGGFVVGVVVALVLRGLGRLRPPPERRVLVSHRMHWPSHRPRPPF
jgi:membrane associated rhomboid family serine protease